MKKLPRSHPRVQPSFYAHREPIMRSHVVNTRSGYGCGQQDNQSCSICLSFLSCSIFPPLAKAYICSSTHGSLACASFRSCALATTASRVSRDGIFCDLRPVRSGDRIFLAFPPTRSGVASFSFDETSQGGCCLHRPAATAFGK